MSLTRNMLNLTSLRAGMAAPTAARAFSTSRCLSLKESTDKDNVDFDKHKQDSIKKQKQGRGHWKPELASDGEEAVKADRSNAGPEETAKLQERTKMAAEEAAKAGTSVRDNM